MELTDQIIHLETESGRGNPQQGARPTCGKPYLGPIHPAVAT